MGKIPLDIKEFRHVGKYSWLISLGSDLLLGFYSSEMCLSRNLAHRLTESDPPEISHSYYAVPTNIYYLQKNKFKGSTKVFPISIKSQMAIKL